MIKQLKSELAKEIIEEFLEQMDRLGINTEDAITLMHEASREELK